MVRVGNRLRHNQVILSPSRDAECSMNGTEVHEALDMGRSHFFALWPKCSPLVTPPPPLVSPPVPNINSTQLL
jgi:hypothetical protein